MTQATSLLRISAERLQADLDALAAIGATADGGVHRPAFSEAHLAARHWFRERAAAAGLDVEVDGAGNHCARLALGTGSARSLLLGSHLDSVPDGGRFDGALGVTCALEVLRTISDTGIALPWNLEAIDLTDEEGAYLGLFGSRAVAGKLSPADLARAHGGRAALERALTRAGLSIGGVLSARRSPDSLVGYLEVHIEQGPKLVRSGTDIGVVTDIVGIRWYRVGFVGRADHAGTTPMAERCDAAQGASAFVLAVRKTVMERFPTCVANVGRMDFEPGAFNVVPVAVDVALECRATDVEQLEHLGRALLAEAEVQASRFGLGLELEELEAIDPSSMDPGLRNAIARAADALRLTHVPMSSGAGHDAQSFAGVCPAGMIFVPSIGGHSHSATELTPLADCAHGATYCCTRSWNWRDHIVEHVKGGGDDGPGTAAGDYGRAEPRSHSLDPQAGDLARGAETPRYPTQPVQRSELARDRA